MSRHPHSHDLEHLLIYGELPPLGHRTPGLSSQHSQRPQIHRLVQEQEEVYQLLEDHLLALQASKESAVVPEDDVVDQESQPGVVSGQVDSVEVEGRMDCSYLQPRQSPLGEIHDLEAGDLLENRLEGWVEFLVVGDGLESGISEDITEGVEQVEEGDEEVGHGVEVVGELGEGMVLVNEEEGQLIECFDNHGE